MERDDSAGRNDESVFLPDEFVAVSGIGAPDAAPDHVGYAVALSGGGGDCMNRSETIYDLGSVDRDEPRAAAGGIPRASRPMSPRHESRPEAAGVGPALAGSLSMFVPGLGQMISGEIAWGLFYFSGMGFCVAALWAVLVTLDRLVHTLGLLDVPGAAIAVALGSLALLVAALHLAAVLHAHALAMCAGDQTAPHPIVAAIASLAIPGWGQVLAGHRRRAALFLGGLWLLSGAWLLVTPAGTRVIARLGYAMPGAMRDGWGPVVMLSAPLVLWAIAVYDAAAGAAAERRR
jgi:TM2 domain-containing membrane protein YozV